MKFLFALMLCLSSNLRAKSELKETITFVDELKGQETLLYLENGQILRVDLGTKYQKGETYLFNHHDGRIVHSKKIFKSKHHQEKKHFFTFEPTIVSSEESQELFKNMTSITAESQCYNRATVWIYQWMNEFKINSFKSWIFFTRKYIREYQFKWWFHVAPSLDVNEDGQIKEKIMDKKYASGPLDPRAWTNIFMKNKSPCRRIENYTDYAHYPESASCFILRTSMYYHQPVDIELFNLFGISKNSFDPSEIQLAFEDTEN